MLGPCKATGFAAAQMLPPPQAQLSSLPKPAGEVSGTLGGVWEVKPKVGTRVAVVH